MSPVPEIPIPDTAATAAFLAGVPCALCLVDEADVLGLCNDPFARLFKTTPERVLNRPVTDFIPETLWRQAGRTAVTGDCFRDKGGPFSAELVVSPLPGSGHWRLITAHAIPSRDNHLAGLATLAGGVAHEFNTVLSIVLGYGELLPELASEPARLRETTAHIMTAARRGADVVYQLQLFARTEECPRAPHHLHQLIRNAVAHTSRHWPASIRVILALAPGPDSLLLNAPQFILALQHLLQNARAALPDDTGCITLRTSLHSDFDPPRFCLSVEDTGVGMDEATRARALDPFFTLRPPGLRGLGLSVVHGILKAHGGSIEIDTPPLGGAHIRLWFPGPATDPFANTLSLSFIDEERQESLIEAVRSTADHTPSERNTSR